METLVNEVEVTEITKPSPGSKEREGWYYRRVYWKDGNLRKVG